ncbi:MAG TPA: beta-L-arabinofuranosidase domain-containing protein, partial [Armatimonadota bacterium]|nr:beta-L-arabinofuranosidase domain-containing protein [Armatimonadota bacterium]
MMQSHAATNRKTLSPVPIAQVTIQDEFWSPKRDTWRTVTIHDALDKFEKTGVLKNFDRIRDGRLDGHHDGPSFYDGLLYETISGSADFLAAQRDAALESRLDGIIDHIVAAAAAAPDGYINTWTQLLEPEHRWGANGGNDHIGHDIYNAGCLVEAAVHYYRATGKSRLLQTAVTLANTMCKVMGPTPKMNQVPGHSLPEGAFIELYHLFREQPNLKREMPVAVNEADYLALAEFWIEHRGVYEGRPGKDRSFGRDAQDHKPVLQQETIEGHAVRATLLFSGVVATALANGREDYLATAQRIWTNMVHRRMYITGGIGAVSTYEGFANDYVLPNDGYLETCAAVGAGFFHGAMHRAFGDARY